MIRLVDSQHTLSDLAWMHKQMRKMERQTRLRYNFTNSADACINTSARISFQRTALALIAPSSGVCFSSLNTDCQADKMMAAWFSLWQVDGSSHQQRFGISINQSMPLSSASEFLDRSTRLHCVPVLLGTAAASTLEKTARRVQI